MPIDINNGLGPVAQGGNKAAERTQPEDPSKSKQAAQERAADARESVKISDDATSMRELQARLERQESFDEARVKEIRKAISEGLYPIDNERLAQKFLELESTL